MSIGIRFGNMMNPTPEDLRRLQKRGQEIDRAGRDLPMDSVEIGRPVPPAQSEPVTFLSPAWFVLMQDALDQAPRPLSDEPISIQFKVGKGADQVNFVYTVDKNGYSLKPGIHDAAATVELRYETLSAFVQGYKEMLRRALVMKNAKLSGDQDHVARLILGNHGLGNVTPPPDVEY